MSYIQTTTENSDFSMDGSYSIYLIDCTNNNVTVTFVDMVQYIGNGYLFTMRRMDTSANTLTFVGTNGQTFDGNSSASLPLTNGSNMITYVSYNNWTSVY